MHQVLVVIPTIVAHPYRSALLEQLVLDPEVAGIVIVDNGGNFEIPPDRTTDWKKVERIRPGCNLNWLASCNLGAALMLERQLPYVCFLNDDTRISRPFFAGLIQSFTEHPDAGVVAPRYNGYFGHAARCTEDPDHWRPEDRDVDVPYVDGTCLLLSRRSIETIGFLDPAFRHPGWGADIDYSYRTAALGLKLYVSFRAMLWHARPEGGTSARVMHGEWRWRIKGVEQARSDLETKYGPDWRDKMPTPPDLF